jgi:hypothetical protein
MISESRPGSAGDVGVALELPEGGEPDAVEERPSAAHALRTVIKTRVTPRSVHLAEERREWMCTRPSSPQVALGRYTYPVIR